MSWLLFDYPRCSTVRKAKDWLKQKGVSFETRHIVDEPLTKEEIISLHQKSGLELKKFFNTSGIKYRELGLKDIIKTAREDELYDYLASEPMLVKRPILTDGNKVLVGFKEKEWEEEMLGWK